MPTAKLICGERYNPLNQKLYKDFKKETGINIDYKTFKEVIWETNELMANAVVDDEAGVKMPADLGHRVVTKYKSKKVPIDWVNSNKLGKRVPLLNLHSFGLIHHIKWFHTGSQVRNIFIFKLLNPKKMRVRLSRNIKAGRKYFKWENTDFWSNTKMERTFNKFYKKEE